MTQIAKEQQDLIEQVLVMGDLVRLTPSQRNQYYQGVCASLGLNPMTRPFEYITLNGKLTLYARKDCTDQLRKIHKVSIRIAERAVMDDLMVVTAEATDSSGRTDSSIGAVSIAGLRGEAKANALMKAETKARRRVTLALCGLGMLDESEIESIPSARISEHSSPRMADRLVSGPSIKSLPAIEEIRVPPTEPSSEAEEAPAVTEPKPAARPNVIEIVVQSIEEHRGKNGPVWKVVSKAGDVYACSDTEAVDDLSLARQDGDPISCLTMRQGTKTVIVSTRGQE